MKKNFSRIFVRILLLTLTVFSLSLLLPSCGQKEPAVESTGFQDIIAIKEFQHDGNNIHVTYEDGNQHSFTITELSVHVGGTVTITPTGQGITEKIGIYIIGSPRYTYGNGELVKIDVDPLFFEGDHIGLHYRFFDGQYMHTEERLYQHWNTELVDSIRTNLKSVTFERPHIENDPSTSSHANSTLDIFDTCQHIQSGAFSELPNLEQITLPAKAKSIGTGAFYNSPKLTEIIFEGTVEQWNAIEKEDGWDYGAADFTVRCSDGEIKMQGTE